MKEIRTVTDNWRVEAYDVPANVAQWAANVLGADLDYIYPEIVAEVATSAVRSIRAGLISEGYQDAL